LLPVEGRNEEKGGRGLLFSNLAWEGKRRDVLVPSH